MSGGKILVSDIAAALGAFATWAGEEFADVSDTRSLFSGLTFKANVLGVAAVGRCVNMFLHYIWFMHAMFEYLHASFAFATPLYTY